MAFIEKARIGRINSTVRGLIEDLLQYNPDAQVNIAGDGIFYIHLEEDGDICIDPDPLNECYEAEFDAEFNADLPEEYIFKGK